MEKNNSKYRWCVICVALVEVAIIACAVIAFINRYWALGGFSCVVFLAVLWFLAGVLRLQTQLAAFETYLKGRDLDGAEKTVRAIKGEKLFYPIMRFSGFRVTLLLSMAKDELDEAKKSISRIRHDGGVGWKYRTAYYTILIALDEGDIALARAEYEDFRLHNQGIELYKEQLEVLDALFGRLFAHNDTPLPESVGNSVFPIVHRILGKHFEEQAAASPIEWN